MKTNKELAKQEAIIILDLEIDIRNSKDIIYNLGFSLCVTCNGSGRIGGEDCDNCGGDLVMRNINAKPGENITTIGRKIDDSI